MTDFPVKQKHRCNACPCNGEEGFSLEEKPSRLEDALDSVFGRRAQRIKLIVNILVVRFIRLVTASYC
jgi:hypothetical protein